MTGWELWLWRRGMNWTREKAAISTGVSLRTWHTWENAQHIPEVLALATVALTLRQDLSALKKKSPEDLISHLQALCAES